MVSHISQVSMGAPRSTMSTQVQPLCGTPGSDHLPRPPARMVSSGGAAALTRRLFGVVQGNPEIGTVVAPLRQRFGEFAAQGVVIGLELDAAEQVIQRLDVAILAVAAGPDDLGLGQADLVVLDHLLAPGDALVVGVDNAVVVAADAGLAARPGLARVRPLIPDAIKARHG